MSILIYGIIPASVWEDISSKYLKSLTHKTISNKDPHSSDISRNAAFLLKGDKWEFPEPFADTLIIGDVPAETLRITGNWYHEGLIILINDGVLIFKNANATINGLIYAFNSSEIMAESSYIYFPQRYIYHLGIMLLDSSRFIIRNCTTNFNGNTIGIAIVGNASFYEENVYNRDFTTFSTLGKPTVYIRNTNLTGEIIVADSGDYTFSKVKTLLVWHHFPKGSNISHTFPPGDTVISYVFDSTLAGISGIKYSVVIDSSLNVMWGMMIEDSSTVSIANSNIRSIGVMFRGRDTVAVSGLVNNNYYTSFTAPISDRTFTLTNSYVQTWSLYPMDTSHIEVSGSILGEILTLDNSSANVQNAFVDGSGGYLGSDGNSFLIFAFSSLTSHLRSVSNSILIFAYSSQSGFFGQVVAANNSIMIIAQSNLLSYPIVYNSAIAWVSNIKSPSVATVNSLVDIVGDAYIETGPEGSFVSFDSYSLYYQMGGDTVWYPIVVDNTTPVKNGILGVWNTYGLEPGSYIIKLITRASTGDSVDIYRVVNLNPLTVYDIWDNINLRGEIYDATGKKVSEIKSRGVYFIKTEKGYKKVLVR